MAPGAAASGTGTVREDPVTALQPGLGLENTVPLAALAAVLVWAAGMFSPEQLFAFWEDSWLWFG